MTFAKIKQKKKTEKADLPSTTFRNNKRSFAAKQHLTSFVQTGYKKLKSGAGFTLIEILVTLLILSLAMTAMVSVLSTNLSSAASVRNSYIASGLVQEGMEVVRNVRDSSWFSGASFNNSIPDGDYKVQWNSASLVPLGSNPALLRDGSSGIYSYDGGATTIFRRKININTVVPGVEKRVIITVDWTERGLSKSVSAEEHMFNWR